MSDTYKLAKAFKRKYGLTIAWRIKSHAKVVDRHLGPEETVKYVFLGQKNNWVINLFNTNIVVLTNKRLIIATKRVVFGYFFTSITPDLFNDLTIKKNIIWGRVIIDTVKEDVLLSNIDPNALGEIENNIVENMMREKRKYKSRLDMKEGA